MGYTLEDAFSTADHDKKGFISVLDFQIILSGNNQKNFNMKDLEYLLRMYDKVDMLKVDRHAFAIQLQQRLEKPGARDSRSHQNGRGSSAYSRDRN